QREIRRSRCPPAGGGRGEVQLKMKPDTKHNQTKKGAANVLEGRWMVNSTRLSTAMRAMKARTITPMRALLARRWVVMSCTRWDMRSRESQRKKTLQGALQPGSVLMRYPSPFPAHCMVRVKLQQEYTTHSGKRIAFSAKGADQVTRAFLDTLVVLL